MLDEMQKAEVAGWVAAGDSLDAIQKRIKAEWGIHLTYLEVRMLVAELPQRTDPPPEEETAEGDAGEKPSTEEGTGGGEGDGADAAGAEGQTPEDAPAGEVSLSFDAVIDPRYLASGSVTFSDGKSGRWILDQYGRFGLAGLPEGYQPTPEDARNFQMKLVGELRARGMA